MGATNKETVDAALRGDAGAWRQLVEEHAGLVWSVIRSLGIGEPDASDVFQAVFLKLTQNLTRIESAQALPAWLITVTRRQCYDLTRHYQRAPLPADNLNEQADQRSPSADTPEDEAVRSSEHQAVLAGLDALTPECQRLLRLLSTNEELSYKEISVALEMPVGSIGPRRKRCLKHLANTDAVRGLRPADSWEIDDV